MCGPQAPGGGNKAMPVDTSKIEAGKGQELAMGIDPGYEMTQSTDAEKRKVLREIIDTPGYDPETKRQAQKQFIEMQKRLKGV